VADLRRTHRDELDLARAVGVPVALLVRGVEARGEVGAERDRELERLAAIAKIGLAFARELAGVRQGDESALDVVAAFVAGDEPEVVYASALADDERKRGQRQPLGALGWYYVLASRIDTAVALRAVEGWGGDEMVGFERHGATCVRLAFTGDTLEDTAEMADALDQWAARMPPGAAVIDRSADQVDVTACDPGPAAAPAPNSVLEAHETLVARAILYTSLVTDGAAEEDARSAANTLALDPAVRGVVLTPGEPTSEQLAYLQEQVAAALAAGS
jgi:hypothetical protein